MRICRQLLTKSGIKLALVRPWLLEKIVDAVPGDHLHDLMFGLLRALSEADATSVMREICVRLREAGRDADGSRRYCWPAQYSDLHGSWPRIRQ